MEDSIDSKLNDECNVPEISFYASSGWISDFGPIEWDISTHPHFDWSRTFSIIKEWNENGMNVNIQNDIVQ